MQQPNELQSRCQGNSKFGQHKVKYNQLFQSTEQPETRNPEPETVFLLFLFGMEVNDALVENLANLARLQFNEGEKEIIKNDLQRMIHFVDKLNELDTAGVAPLLHMTDNENILREDVVQGSISREEAVKNAPDTDGVFFKVPKVIRK